MKKQRPPSCLLGGVELYMNKSHSVIPGLIGIFFGYLLRTRSRVEPGMTEKSGGGQTAQCKNMQNIEKIA